MAVEFEMARPPLVPAEYASDRAFPTARDVELAEPPLVAMDVAHASAATAAATTASRRSPAGAAGDRAY